MDRCLRRVHQPLLDKVRKGSVDLVFGAGAHNADLLADSAAGRPKAARKGLRKDRIGRVDEQSNGDQFVQQLQLLRPYLDAQTL